MLLKSSKIFYILFVFYISWFQDVFFIIPRMPLILGSGMVLLWISYEAFRAKNSKIIFSQPVIIWTLFSFYILFSGAVIATNTAHLLDSWFTFIQNLVLVFYIVNISVVEGNNVFFLRIQGLLSVVYMLTMLFWGYIGSGNRLQLSESSNSNGDGITLMFGIFIILLLSNKNKLKNLIFSMFLIGLFLYTITLTGSRKSFLVAITIIILWFLFAFKDYWKKYTIIKKIISVILIFSSLLIILYILFPLISESALYTRLTESGVSISDDATRSGMYKEALDYFQENPLFGIGFKQFENLSMYNTYSHSTYAEILSTTGLIGTIIYFLGYVVIIYNLLKIYNKYKGSYKCSEALQYLVLMFVLIVLGTGVIHFYGIIYFMMFGLMISFYTTTHSKIKDNSCTTNSELN